ncbi:unnamed protein product [Prorocentrum cordatum]|uniref:Uncharacterized protein n=1 Tax=Prorocentrum cordatum TaxID=2364126 RepID=A0ABN9VRQ5_9DINO|nr:unnamed protein product [Polarella glacialis]
MLRNGTSQVLLSVALLSSQLQAACAALNVEANAPQDMVASLRQSIFIEAAYLKERRPEPCSSLDGPARVGALLGSGAPGKPGDGPGVIPDRLLQELGWDIDVEGFATLDHDALEALRRGGGAAGGPAPRAPPAAVAAGTEVAVPPSAARGSAELGLLHFGELQLDRRVPLTFSDGLPSGVVATWDGRWLARDCSGAPARAGAAGARRRAERRRRRGRGGARGGGARRQRRLPALLQARGRPLAVGALAPGRGGPRGAGRQPPRASGRVDHPPGLVEARGRWLGRRRQRATLEEVVFIAAAGLEIGALEVAAPGPAPPGERSPVLLLSLAGGPRPSLQLRREALDMAVAAPHLVSLQEVVDRDLQFRRPGELPPAQRAARPAGLLSVRSQLEVQQEDSLAWISTASQHQALYELEPLIATSSVEAISSIAKALVGTIDGTDFTWHVPPDLKRELRQARDDVIDALSEFVSWRNGWGDETPISLPWDGSSDDMQRYLSAKRKQTNLDLLTAALLYRRHGMTSRLADSQPHARSG